MKCKKNDCPIFEECDKEQDQAYYCRKIELLVHLSRLSKTGPKSNYVNLGLPVLVH